MTREEQKQSLADKWEQLTIANDQMFSMVMENDAICLELLRRIFPELVISVFRPSWVRERSECAKQKTTCYAGGRQKLYKKGLFCLKM